MEPLVLARCSVVQAGRSHSAGEQTGVLVEAPEVTFRNPVATPCAVDEPFVRFGGEDDPTVPSKEHLALSDKLPNFNVNEPVAPPNRFDPYEALDLIDRANGSGYSTLIQQQVHALRAYITGMER